MLSHNEINVQLKLNSNNENILIKLFCPFVMLEHKTLLYNWKNLSLGSNLGENVIICI